jgi:mannan endo-1,4-beta-mannosidase
MVRLFVGLFLLGSALSWAQGSSPFVQTNKGQFVLNGSPFRFGGINSFVLMFSPKATVDQLLDTAVSNHLTVIRMWVFDDVSAPSNAFWLQSLAGGAPVYNDTSTGLGNVDYAVYRAGQLGLKLIINFVNNWTYLGGMDQYVQWRGLQYHDQFYTDSTIRAWYQNWVSHVLNHANTYSGVVYKNDPTIMMWELANELECGDSNLPTSGTCSTSTILSWITAMGTFVKSVDPNHLVGVGDEGFFCNPKLPYSEVNCEHGVDSVTFSQSPAIDAVGFHLYPDGWGQSMAWADSYIDQHISAANTAGKPIYMGEFGTLEGNIRNQAYRGWTNRLFLQGGGGALAWALFPDQVDPSVAVVWNLQQGQVAASLAERRASYNVFAGSPLLNTLGDFGQMMAANRAMPFAPVAGFQWAVGSYNSPVTLNPVGNVAVFGNSTINSASIDLDPNTSGQQTSLTVAGGTFVVVGQSVQFVPKTGFNGLTQASYTVADTNGNRSNVGYLFVIVNPSSSGQEEVESFETGTDFWGAEGKSVGTVAQSTNFHTDGSYGLQLNVGSQGWFGSQLTWPLDLSGRPSISFDINSPSGSFGQSAIAFQSGPSNIWCQNALPWPSTMKGGTSTVTIQLDVPQLQCFGGFPDFTNVTSLWVWMASTGVYYVDNIRAAAPATAKANPQLPSISGISNAASGVAAAAPTTYLAIYGSNFVPVGSASATWSDSVVNGNLPTTLANASVTVGGQAAYLYAVAPNQINILTPNLLPGPLDVVVSTAAGNSSAFTIPCQSASPAFFTWGNFAVATHLDYSLAVKNGTFTKTSAPAKPGEVIILWGTGFGTTSPLAPVGLLVPTQTYAVGGATVNVGGLAATVYATALTPGLAGLYQVAIQVPPELADGDYPLVASVNGVSSGISVLLTVKE